jgi:hypothetical protein
LDSRAKRRSVSAWLKKAPGCINATTWLEHLTLRSQAIQNAYDDMNSEVDAGTRLCPKNAENLYILANDGAPCPIQPFVLASAFANGSPATPGGPASSAAQVASGSWRAAAPA